MRFLFLFFVYAWLFCSCSTWRLIVYNFPASGDQYLFPNAYFPASSPRGTLPTAYSPAHFNRHFQEFLRSHHTSAFLVIRNDTVRIEYYAPPISPSQHMDLFSISKSIVAGVVAIAWQEGYITSLSDTLGQYLSELPTGYAGISIGDLLNMRSGIPHSMFYTTRLYYSSNLNKTLSRIPLRDSPGKNYGYSNADTQWLVALIEEVTGRKFIDYFYQKMWLPMGMENPGSWTLDSRRHQTARGFCGLNLTLRDLGKLGLCYLHNGYYNQRQLIPADWISTTFNTPAYPEPTPQGTIYNMHWRLLTPGVEALAKGLRGQYLYLNKKANTVIIRLGTRESSVEWIPIFRKLIESERFIADLSSKNSLHNFCTP